jgi:hypothetical protein
MFFERLKEKIGNRIVDYLDQPITGYTPFFAPPLDVLEHSLKPGDVILVEGNTRISSIIKYLTQSTWSHSAIYVGDALPPDPETGEPRVLIEALANRGVVASPLSKYAKFNTRICRPVGLKPAERTRVIAFCIAYLGRQYDLKYIIDLIRFLVPYPPVPVWMRRRMLAIGHGDPTRAICSTMIAEAFHAISYPILPDAALHSPTSEASYAVSPYVEREAVGIRRDGLYTPRDFDVSPFFEVVKPTIEAGFDFHRWPADRRRSFIHDWASDSFEEARRKIEAGVRAVRTRGKRLGEPEKDEDGTEAAPPEAGR